MNQHSECSPALHRGVDGRGELRASIDDARWRYDKVMEAVTGADLKASIIATVQAAALGALLTSATPSNGTTPNRALFVAGIGALLARRGDRRRGGFPPPWATPAPAAAGRPPLL